MARDIKHAVILHIDTNGDHTLRVWDPAGEILVLWVDENCVGDRVYEQTAREADIADLTALIGSNPIGHAGDGRLDDQTVQAIRAMHWRMTGGKLGGLTSALSASEGVAAQVVQPFRDEPQPPPNTGREPR